MRTILTVVFIITSANLLSAQQLTGRWKGSFTRAGGEHGIPQLFTLQQEGEKVNGSGGPDDSEQYPISKGTVNGNMVRFELYTARSRFLYQLELTSGPGLKGTLEIRSINRVDKATVSLVKDK